MFHKTAKQAFIDQQQESNWPRGVAEITSTVTRAGTKNAVESMAPAKCWEDKTLLGTKDEAEIQARLQHARALLLDQANQSTWLSQVLPLLSLGWDTVVI